MPADRFDSLPLLIRKPTIPKFLTALTALALTIGLVFSRAPLAGAQAASSSKWTVTIVLPARVVAGRAATLAVLGVDGRLASDVAVSLGNDQRVTTDATGRASFTAPSSAGVLLARGSGSSAATLVDAGIPDNPKDEIRAASIASLREPFSICGTRFRSDADANHVRLNGEAALVMAASAECLAVLPGSKAVPGPAQISVQTASGQWTAATTLVALEPEFPKPALLPGEKGRLLVNVRGSDQPLGIVVGNETPGILRLLKGQTQELRTSGGAQNCAWLPVEAIRSGDFSLEARLLPSPDLTAARRYLEAAAALAEKGEQRDINRVVKMLGRGPEDVDGPRRDVDRILTHTIEGDLRTLLAAARASL